MAVVGVAIFGPFFAPFSPDATVGAPFARPSGGHALGLDYLGRDVLSRFLWGGRTTLLLASLIVVVAYAIGLTVGLIGAYRGGWLDALVTRSADVILSFPSIVVILLIVTRFGSSVSLLVIAAAVTFVPRIVRIVRAAALPFVGKGYVEAARARGERVVYVVAREILPNIRMVLLVDIGGRFTNAILLVAALSFLGLGLKPPQADWGLMVSENLGGLTVQPWPVIAPIIALGMLAIGTNLVIDGYRRSRLPED